ncbi:hypothetical protein F5Y05DRAFT_362193 [Hypoxylon sp. FL0543]|nr:hypothetical protein F5Y05DRAFT_362193 [Hypoxylon sp. FL0543]
MAEIANSDSPDPLSSTPPLFASDTPTVSLPSTIGDLDSLQSESRPSDRTRPRPRQHQNRQSSSPPGRESDLLDLRERHLPDSSPAPGEARNHRHQIRQPSSPASTVAPPSSMSSGNESDLLDFLERQLPRNSQAPSDDYYFDDWDDAEPDPHGVELYDDDDDDDYFEENQPFGNLPIGIMDQARDIEDELVEMEFEAIDVDRPRSPLLPQRSRRRSQSRAQPEVIDLTGENDSPPQPATQHQSQNLRRQRSQQRNTPPRLARSDAGYMGSQTVIDLISDSDSDPAELPPPIQNDSPRRSPNFQRLRAQPRLRRARTRQPNFGYDMGGTAFQRFRNLIRHIPIFQLVNNPQGLGNNREEDEIAIIGHRNLMPDVIPPANLPPIDFNYGNHPFVNPPPAAGGPAAKPAHDPPKETREGFTRHTGEDVVAICPSCEEELAYDPGADDAHSGPPPAKKARTKKDKAEHHFWAVKACGHVYCRKCYENRKPVGKHPIPVGFRPDPNGTKNKMLCAVEDCDSDVSIKSNWVGIFM